MGELAIRRNRGMTTVPRQETGRAEKPAAGARSQSVARTAAFTVSETLQNLMSRVVQAESQTRESRRTLQNGEATLAEVQDSLDQMAELAQESAGGGETDRAALQAKLDQLREGIDRMLSSALSGGSPLFLDEGADLETGTAALLYAVMGGAAQQENVRALPDWLINSIAQDSFNAERLLTALGLDKTASGAELLAAITGSSLDGDSAAGYMAALYLGAVIAGGSAWVSPSQALDGLRQLLDSVSEGVTPDQALETLTNGAFSSVEDFQSQFSSGTAPGLQDFLSNLLLSGLDSPLLDGSTLLNLLAGLDGMSMDSLMDLLDITQTLGASPEAFEAGNLTEGAEAGALERDAPVSPELSARFGNVVITGQDLSGVSFDEASGVLTLSGSASVTIQGTGQEPQAILITGSGTVTLQDVHASTLTIGTAEARIFNAGEAVLDEISLRQGSNLVLSGGLTKSGGLYAAGSGSLRLTGGAAFILEDDSGRPGTLPVPVVLDGPVVLAARAASVSNPSGETLKPFDELWKVLLPGWSRVTEMAADGRQAKMTLASDLSARLWLEKWDLSKGHPAHALIFRGRDNAGRPQTRYAYLHWNQSAGTFEEVAMYPNPFAVTGGVMGRDWVYEEADHTLRILTNQVNGISGGSGTDANQTPFSGRVVLADGIGEIELSLDGVVCRVSQGSAFSLGRENEVTLLLKTGTGNHFESGAGCAGISLGEGSTLVIDRAEKSGGRNPDGTLTASGGEGGAGIGRDSGGGRDQTCRILIRGGVITASGAGGGAGIGGGKHGAMGSITLLGGTVSATGGNGGGAGIGGALGAPAGDISIRGGKVTAVAVAHAAAIGAGVQGACGDILITGTARIVKARGGNPGADIGACLFGGCGKVQITGAADIGAAKLLTRTGVPLQMGGETMTLPQFRLSARTLRLDKLNVSTQEQALAARLTIDTDRRLVAQIQSAYSAMFNRLTRNLYSLYSSKQYTGMGGPLRDPAAAGTLLDDMRRSIPLSSCQAIRTHGRRGMENVGQLLK